MECYQSISVIIPVRNEESNIASVLDSLIFTKYPKKYLEIIVVDGASSDNTWSIIQKYKEKYSYIVAIKNQSKIVSTGFNLALNETKGVVIIRIDGHCEIPPDYIERCIELLDSRDADIVGGSIMTESSGLIGRSIAIAQSSFFGVGGVKFRQRNIIQPCYVDTLAFGAHKRDIFSKIGGYDEEMVCNQDDEFNYRVIRAGNKIWLEPSIKTKYFSRSSFTKLFKQYFNYGYFKVRVIQKRREVISIRHIIPTAFILSLILSFISGFLLNQFWIKYFVILIYLILNIFSSIFLSPEVLLIPFVSISFCTLHFGYGLGFLWGMFRFIAKWGDNEIKDNHFNREQFIANSPVSK